MDSSDPGLNDDNESFSDTSNNKVESESVQGGSRKKRIFSLVAANSFGRDEVGPAFSDNGKALRIESKS